MDATQREHKVMFGTMNTDGELTNVRYILQADIVACEHSIFSADHYRRDGSCKCDEPVERAMMIREWGYEASDFQRPLRGEDREIKLTDVTTGIQWDCSSCPAWGLSPTKDAAKAESAKHSCYTREEANS